MVSLYKIKTLQNTLFYTVAVVLVAVTSFTLLSTRTVVSTYREHQTKLLLSDELHNRCQVACAAGEQIVSKSTPFLAVLSAPFSSVNPPVSFIYMAKNLGAFLALICVLYVCLYVRSRHKLSAYSYWLN